MLQEQYPAVETRGEVSERVMRERQELFSSPARVDSDKLKIELEVYAGSEAKSPAMRRAEVFSRFCRERPVFIDGNPIVGSLTKYKYGGCFLPYSDFRWAKGLTEFALQRGNAPVPEEDMVWIRKAIAYWDGKNIYDRSRKLILKHKGVDVDVLKDCGVALNIVDSANHAIYPDYRFILNKGLRGIISDIDSRKKDLDIGSAEGLKKLDFYEAATLSLQGMLDLAQRYASLAREMAAKEDDPEKRKELGRIAEICEQVPAYPARNFREALQAVWFTTIGIWTEYPTIGVPAPLRFPQYMYPFYKKDKEEGNLSDEEVIELIHFYFLKLNTISMILSPAMAVWNQSRLAQQLTIGGLTPDGEDATNELDFLLLEAQRRMMLPEPLLAQ